MELEREFISRIIANSDLTMKTAIRPKDLDYPAYRAAYGAVFKLLGEGVKPDFPTVVASCREFTNDLARLDSVTTSNFEFFERELSKEIQRRRLRVAALEFERLNNANEAPDRIVAEMESLLSGSRVVQEHRDIRTLYDCAMEYGPKLEERAKNKGELVGIPTGLPSLDTKLGGFQPGTYYVGARPSDGKTALMISMMRAALSHGFGAGLISIESSDLELIGRVLSGEGPVLMSNLKKGTLAQWEYNGLSDAFKRIKEYNGHVYFNTKTDIATLESISRRMVETLGCKIIFIDYLQRVYAEGKTRFDQVTSASRVVTDIAKGLGVPVVCLAQTGRPADTEEPSLHHFQHSSAIEQDADVAMIIRHKRNEDGKIEESYLHILKNRDGEVGSIPVYFDMAHVRFMPIERDGGV